MLPPRENVAADIRAAVVEDALEERQVLAIKLEIAGSAIVPCWRTGYGHRWRAASRVIRAVRASR